MGRMLWLAAVLIAEVNPAAAFDNIEADAAYDGPIKLQIEREFRAGLTMLSAQAEGLKMEVREKDLKALALHMYHKAVVQGGCLDDQISNRKASAKRSTTFDVKGCVASRLKLVSWLETRRPDNSVFDNMFENCLDMATAKSRKEAESPYPFLRITVTVDSANFTFLKECYDKALPFKDIR